MPPRLRAHLRRTDSVRQTNAETERRAVAAEAESEQYADLLRQREELVTDLKVSNARMEEQLAAARRDLERIESKQKTTTRMLTEIRDEMTPAEPGVYPENGEEQ